MELSHLTGKCLFCEKQFTPYNSHPEASRFCCTKGLTIDAKEFFGADLELFPTIYPFPIRNNNVFAPPHPQARPAPDVFAISAKSNAAASENVCLPTLPYPDELDLNHLRCGNSTLHDLGKLSTSFGFTDGSVSVCDMATYLWSNTLKDPRSWAVIKTALACSVKHLGVWTAGNAGLSVAKVAYAVNRLQPPSQRIEVHCYGVEGELSEEHFARLQDFGATVSIFSPVEGKIFTPHQALEQLNGRLPEKMRIKPEDYWDVSDGWDGLALYMYRLLGRQLCVHLKPQYIVVPLGTGDIFYGLYLGMRDSLREGYLDPTDCQLVAAVPLGTSILDNYRTYNLRVRSASPDHGRKPPVAPKLATIYTPLLLVMYQAFLDDNVAVVEVSKEEQAQAVRLTATCLAAEASALLAFAALRGIAKRHIGRQRGMTSRQVDVKVVVVNTGCGAIDIKERNFLSRINVI